MKLLAAVDLSKASGYVIEAVHRVAMATDAEVYLLYVIIPLPSIPGPEFHPAIGSQVQSDQLLDEQEQLAGLVKQLVEVGVNATALIVQGDPVKIILSEAKRLGAELIIVGSHGHSLLFDALLGSVSAGLLRKSTLPVLIVPVRGI
jgi:nucleotide-binding universal stress UspA family protein